MNIPMQEAASTITPKLLAQVAKGDQQALSQLYDQSSTVLYSLAVRILGNHEEAADLLHNIYLEVWRKTVRYDVGRGSPIAWLITVTRSRALDRLRASTKDGRRPFTGSRQDRTTTRIENRHPGLFEPYADQELRNLVCGAWGNLPEAQQHAIAFPYYEGTTPQELAERLHQPLGTVKTRIKLGMSKLRESLRPYWEQRVP